jgi:ketosteroid isomerase-like protein
MRLPTLIAASLVVAACSARTTVSDAERRLIIDSLTRQVKGAYDLSRPGVEQRLLSLYPDSGQVVSAAGGRMITSRDTLALGIHEFWQNVGANMQQPTWVWDRMVFDVLSPNAAAMTATYHVPHRTPRGEPHTIGGAWTAVFQKRGNRWVIVQEHLSDLPPMPDSAMAAMPGMTMPAKPPKSPKSPK